MTAAQICRVIAAVVAAWWPTAAAALSITAARPHGRDRACAAVERVLADVASKRDQITPFFSTEKHGFVEYDEQAAFFAAMTSSEGKVDARPLRLTRLYRLTDEEFDPLYIAAIDRLVWHEYRTEEDWANGGSERIQDPRHYSESSYWLVSFQSNQVMRLREAFEIYQLADERRRVKGCGS